MKYFLLFNLLILSLIAENLDNNEDTNSTVTLVASTAKDVERPKEDIIIVKDKSGFSDDQVRKHAKETDTKKVGKVSVGEVIKVIDDKGKVDISKIQEKWADLSPSPVKYDWVQTKSGEWFKGEIKALYDDDLEFDSDEIGVYTFDFNNVVQIKSYHIISVNIENIASFPGILRLKGDELTIIQGKEKFKFKKTEIVSFAPDGKYEKNFWSAKATLHIDVRSGNTNQYDYSTQVKIQRRTANSRLSFDYLGRITAKDDEETANDHRFNQKYDRYLSRNFFWTPVFSELYTDKYKNIEQQITLGAGLGYTFIDTKKTKWSVSGGPAFLYTKHDTVDDGKELSSYSPAMALSTMYEIELTKITDITYNYALTYADESAGTYKHHMLLTFENELTSWLDLDITGVWDYILTPETASDGVEPVKNDYQLLIGLGLNF